MVENIFLFWGILSHPFSMRASAVFLGVPCLALFRFFYISIIFLTVYNLKLFVTFANDTVIIQCAKDPESLKHGLEIQLKYLSAWFFCNKLSVNTELIFFGRKQKVVECKGLPPLSFQNAKISPKSDVNIFE